MLTIRTAFAAASIALIGLFATAAFQAGRESTGEALYSSTMMLRVADNNTPDGTETQDPEQQEQQQENQQLCGNPNGCG